MNRLGVDVSDVSPDALLYQDRAKAKWIVWPTDGPPDRLLVTVRSPFVPWLSKRE